MAQQLCSFPEEQVGRVAIISDTHLPRGDRRLPEDCRARLQHADLIIHAGDLSRLSVLEDLQTLGTVCAVHGNVDDAATQAELPESLECVIGAVRIAVVHDAGPASGRLRRLRRRFPEADAVIFGHSHIPLHESDEGFQIFNPGSPTDPRRQPHPTMGWGELATGRLELGLITLGRAAKR